MKKLLSLIVILSILGVAVLFSFNFDLNRWFSFPETLANGCAQRNVWGYAWSENIGWISFSCKNCDTDNNSYIDSGACGGDNSTTLSQDYGVDINNSTGNFSGYAWSENIGWVSFAPPGPYPEAPNYSARLDTITNQITGWARACAGTVNGDCLSASRTDGWDGWIKMSGKSTDGSDYGVSRSVCDLIGYAWGSDVVGWIKFKGTAQDGSPYGVITTFCNPPSANNLQIVQPNYCIVTWPAAIFSWIFTDLDPGDTQSAYQIQVDDDINFLAPYIIDTGKVPCTPPCSYATLPNNLSWNTTYYWRLRVWDSFDTSSLDWIYPPSPPGSPTGQPGAPFTTPAHAYPYPDFTHSPKNPSIGEIVNFTDTSKCYSSPGNVEYNCKDGASIQYAWDFDYIAAEGFTVDSTVKGNVTTTYDDAKPYEVRLRITDNTLPPPDNFCIGGGDSPVGATLRLPEWKEIPPF